MDGIHDLGGMDGMGRIEREEDEPAFHADWEAAVFAMAYGTEGGPYNPDEGRYVIEQMPPSYYLDSPYYEGWLYLLERKLTEEGIVDEDELREALARLGTAASYDGGLPERYDPELAETWLGFDREDVTARRDPQEPAYEEGDTVVVKNMHPEGHTRCPRYVRGAEGRVETVHGTFVLPDANAMREGEQPEPLYNVEFDAEELWGEDAEANESLRIDLFESYLEPTDE